MAVRRKISEQKFNGGKYTDTTIGFQMEYDIGLVTGRIHGDDGIKTYPWLKANNFKVYLKQYKGLIYDAKSSYALYVGGPNELAFSEVSDYKAADANDYGNMAENAYSMNNNRHSIINHVTVLDTYSSTYDDSISTGVPFSEFVDKVETEFSNDMKAQEIYDKAFQEVNPDIDIGLLYDITYGLFYNVWNLQTQDVLQLRTGLVLESIPESQKKTIKP